MFQNYLSFIHSSSVTTVIFLGSPLEGKNAGFLHHWSTKTKGGNVSELEREGKVGHQQFFVLRYANDVLAHLMHT